MVLACGQTRNVLDHNPAPAAGGGGQGSGQGGSSGGGSGGSGGGASGSATTAVGGRAVTWNPQQCHPTPVAEPTDPTLRPRWDAARAYCETLGKQGCFQFGVIANGGGCTSEQLLDTCVAQALWFLDESIPPGCEVAWSQVLECGAQASSDPALCQEASLLSIPTAPNASCAKQNEALVACLQQSGSLDEVAVAGSYTQCHYARTSATSCEVRCPVGEQTATLSCSGTDGLPKQCTCQLNGHPSFAYDLLFVNDCADAARQAADGLCSGLLDCCFEYIDDTRRSCLCADPTRYGYDSCQAMMDVAAGEPVVICPGLLPNTSNGAQDGCWPPGMCKMP